MHRIKHHFCWVKAVAIDAADTDDNAKSGAFAFSATPLTSTGTFKVLPMDDMPAIQAQDLTGLGVLRTATGVFRTLVGNPLKQLSVRDLPATATAQFRVLNDAALPQLESFDLHLTTSTVPLRALSDEMFRSAVMPTSGEAELNTATGPIEILLNQSLPPLTFAGATFMGAWQAEPDPFETPEMGVALRFMPMVGSRGDALEWRTTEAGKAWAEDALAISLLSFAAIGDL